MTGTRPLAAGIAATLTAAVLALLTGHHSPTVHRHTAAVTVAPGPRPTSVPYERRHVEDHASRAHVRMPLTRHNTTLPQTPPHPTISATPQRQAAAHTAPARPRNSTPTPPPAAPATSLWDRLAGCESSHQWHDTEGAFDGGLQFTASTWTAYGGGQYAPTADQASRLEQITVARRVLASQGWAAWPVCSHVIGAAP